MCWPDHLLVEIRILGFETVNITDIDITAIYADPASQTRNIVEGSRGAFYTIGRLSLPAADTLRRRRKQEKT